MIPRRMYMRRTRGLSLVLSVSFMALASLILSGCPSPITDDIVTGSRDLTPPSIVVTSPSEYASYSRLISVEGAVYDMAERDRPGRVESLSYEIVGHTAVKTIVINPDGSFNIAEPNDLRENVVVLIKAVDWNGNEAEHRLPLTFPGNEIPSFTSTESSREVALSWNPVPGTTTYTLYVESSSKAPDPATSVAYSSVSSPYTVTQLSNGSLYSFLLVGDGPDGRKNYSAVLRSVPLSRMHLLPSATPRYDGIELVWRSYPVIPSYTVLRASSNAGPWVDVSGPVNGSSFFDSSASGGGRYYYAVQPNAYSTVRSEYIEASSDVVSSRQDAPVASYDAVTFSRASSYKDGYLYILDYYAGLRILDVHNPALPRQVGFLALSSSRGLAVEGSYAYLGAYVSDPGYGGASAPALLIVDISTPSAPVLVGTQILGTGGLGIQAEDVAVLGDLVFIAGFNRGFMVVDATNKASPVLRITNRDFSVLGQNYAVAAQTRSGGTRVLAVAGNSASALYTVTGTAASPVLTRNSSALGTANDVAFGESGSTILYVSGGSSVASWQTSALASPALLSTLNPAGASVGTGNLSISGKRVFVALNIYGYAVIDAANDSSLRTALVRAVPGNTEHVAIGNAYAYVSTGQDYPFRIYGANDPSAALIVKTLSDVRTGSRLAAYGDRLYVSEYTYNAEIGSNDWAASTYSLVDPANPVRVGTDVGDYSPYSFAFAGAKSYIAAERSGIMQWSLENTDNPSVLPPWYLSTQGGSAWDIELSGHYAVMSTGNSWLNMVDLSRSEQGSMTIVAALSTQGTSGVNYEARGLALRGSYAFVANELAGLRAVDLSKPEFPSAIAGYGAPAGQTSAVAVYGDYVLTADSSEGLMIYDATNPRSWSNAGTAPVWKQPSLTPAYDVIVRGSYAYVAYGASGLGIWDITNPLAPVQAGLLFKGGFSPKALTIYRNYLYALDGATKLYVVDLVP